MGKKSSRQKPSPDLDLKTLIADHSLFFDHLVELIPARFYLPADDDDRPYFQGLSKVAKASAKKESRENLKKARRARFDPSNRSSTLDLLKAKSAADENPSENEEAEIDNPQTLIPSVDRSSVTYDELRQKLHRKIEEARANRNTRPDMKSKDRFGKRKRDEESGEEEKKKAKVEKGGEVGVPADLTFGQVKLGSADDKKMRKKKLSKAQELEKAEKLAEAKKDPEKGKKVVWSAAASRAAGVKVHDDPKLVRESMKKEKKRQQKHAEKWKERLESRDKARAEKQRTRADNIKERIQQKKTRRIEKREKKLMRPGFEGRKQGYINE